jgi:hypothetical protein
MGVILKGCDFKRRCAVSYSLVGADRNTHLKIAAVAFGCSALAAFVFHASLFAPSISKEQLAKNQFADAVEFACTKRLAGKVFEPSCSGTSHFTGRF